MGRPLQVDLATSNLKRPSIAWLLIEFDVAKPLVNCIWIGVDDFCHWQKVEYDYWPNFCSFCEQIGLLESDFLKKNPVIRPSWL